MQQFLATYGYAAVFILMVAESACIPVPSELIMLFGGAFAAGAVPGSHPNLIGIIAAGAVGNLAGSYLAWALGRYGGQAAWHRWGRYLWLREDDLARAERWFTRYGAPAVFFGRLLPVVRTFISLPAGIAAMPSTRFGAYTLAGAIPWTSALAGAGYALGGHWRSVADAFHGPTDLVAAILAVLIIAGLVVFWRRRSRNTGHHDSTRGTGTDQSSRATEILPSATAATERFSPVTGPAPATPRHRPRPGAIATPARTKAKTAVGAGLLGALLILGALALSAPVTHDELHLDQIAASARFPAASDLAIGLTDAASEAVGIALLALAVVALWLRRRRFDAARLVAMTGASWVLALLIKYLLARPRPPARLWLIHPDLTGSFPSGHTTTAAVTVIIISMVLLGARRWRVPATLAALMYALAVGASRVYLGDHYPTDVAGSYLTVAAAVLLVSAATDLAPIRRLATRILRIPTPGAGTSPQPSTKDPEPDTTPMRLPRPDSAAASHPARTMHSSATPRRHERAPASPRHERK